MRGPREDDPRTLPGLSIGAAIRMRFALADGLLFYARGGLGASGTGPRDFWRSPPTWVPDARAGCCTDRHVAEIAGAVGLLLWKPVRRWAGIGLALYALCVWPANFNHAFNDITVSGTNLDWSYHGPRLLAQPLIIWLALWVGEATEWPFGRR